MPVSPHATRRKTLNKHKSKENPRIVPKGLHGKASIAEL